MQFSSPVIHGGDVDIIDIVNVYLWSCSFLKKKEKKFTLFPTNLSESCWK